MRSSRDDITDIEHGHATQDEAHEALIPSRVTTTAKDAAYYTLLSLIALLVSTPTAANAAASAANIAPANLTPSYFINNLTRSEQFWTTVDGTSSLLVNAVVFFDFSLQLNNARKGIAAKLAKDNLEKALFGAVLVLAILSAAAAFGLGEDNFAYMMDNFWLVPALSFALSTFVTRAVSLDGIATRLRNQRNDDAQLQAQAAHALKNIDPIYLAGVTNTFNVVKKIYFEATTEPTYDGLAQEFFTQFNVRYAAPKTFRKITPPQRVASVLGVGVNATIAVSLAVANGTTFAQKGFNGINDIAKMFKSTWVNNLPIKAQIPLGLGSGIASGALYARSYDYITPTLRDVLTHIKEHKHQYSLYVATAAIFLLNIPASKSGQNMGQKIIDNNTSWIYPWFSNDHASNESSDSSTDKDSFAALLYVWLNQIGVLLINSKSCLDVLVIRPPRVPTPNLDFQTFIRRLSNPVSTIIKDGADGSALRQAMALMTEHFDTRQKTAQDGTKRTRPSEQSPLLAHVNGTVFGNKRSSVADNDPDRHIADNRNNRPTAKTPSTGMNG